MHKGCGNCVCRGVLVTALRDAGEGAIASKVEAAGRIAILVMTLPILEGLMEMCVRAVSSV